MKLEININSLEKKLADFVNDFEYKTMTEKLKEYDFMADVEDQRAHHFNKRVLHIN